MSNAGSRKRAQRRKARTEAKVRAAKRAAWLEKQIAQEPKAARSTPRKSLLLQFRLRPVETLKKFSVLYLAAFAPRVEGNQSQPQLHFNVTHSFSFGKDTSEPRIGKVYSRGNSTSSISAMHLYKTGSPHQHHVIGDKIDVETTPPTDNQTVVATVVAPESQWLHSLLYASERNSSVAFWIRKRIDQLGVLVAKRMTAGFSVEAQVEVPEPEPETATCPAVMPLNRARLEDASMSVSDDAVVVTFCQDVNRANATDSCDIHQNRVVVLDTKTLEENYHGVVAAGEGRGIYYSKSLGVALEHRQMLLLTFEYDSFSEIKLILDRRGIDGSPVSRRTLAFDRMPRDFSIDCHEKANRIATVVEVDRNEIGFGVHVIEFRSCSLDGQSPSSPVIIGQLQKGELSRDLKIERVRETSVESALQEGDYLVSWVDWDLYNPLLGLSRVQVVRDSKPLGEPMTIKPDGRMNCYITGSDFKVTREGMVVGVEEECNFGFAPSASRVEVVEVTRSDATTTGAGTTGKETTGRETTGKETTTTGNKAEVSDSQSQSGLSGGAIAGIASGVVAGTAALVTCGIFAVKKLSALPERYHRLVEMGNSDSSSDNVAAPGDTTPLLQRLAAMFRR